MNPGASEFARVVTDDGSITLAHPAHGQACHSRAGAWTESRERYAAACRVRERALEIRGAGGRALSVLDVGTGLGLNVAAALEASIGTGVALEVTSLEVDERVLEATLALGPQPLVDLERVHAPVRDALQTALASLRDEGPGRRRARVPLADGWFELHVGDGTLALPAMPPECCFDVVFLDPFSPAVDPPLWRPAFLAEVARRMNPGARLSTYTASAAVRAGLMAAGLAVGPAPRVLGKVSGTLAACRADVPAFDPATERKLRRRAERLPSHDSRS